MLLESVFTGSTRLLLEKMIYVLIIVVIASVIAKMIATTFIVTKISELDNSKYIYFLFLYFQFG